MDLSPHQFSQDTLPGLASVSGGLPKRPKKPAFVDQSASKYSGQIPGQMVMGVHNLGGDAVNHISRGRHQEPFYEVDRTGFVQELGDTGWHGPKRWASPADIEAKHGVRQTRHLYRTYGGSHADTPRVQEHWANQPLKMTPTDAPVHTGQDERETLWGHDATAVGDGAVREQDAEGRGRINSIRESLQRGESIQNPAWLVKRAGRLYALDGHHRVTAAREEGHSHFPARVWDYDAEEAATKKAGW